MRSQPLSYTTIGMQHVTIENVAVSCLLLSSILYFLRCICLIMKHLINCEWFRLRLAFHHVIANYLANSLATKDKLKMKHKQCRNNIRMYLIYNVMILF